MIERSGWTAMVLQRDFRTDLRASSPGPG